jgi:uroporphyrinogen decarboxylase
MKTQLEMFTNTINHIPTGNFLYRTSFTTDLKTKIKDRLSIRSDESLIEELGFFNPVTVQPEPKWKPTQEEINEKFEKYFTGIDRKQGTYIDARGVMHIPGSMYHFTHYISPLRNAESMDELERFYYPGDEVYGYANMRNLVRRAHEKGLVTVCPIGKLYEFAWQIRGYQEFLTDMLVNPEFCDYIFDRIQQRNLLRAEAAAKADVDYLHTGDDVANQNALMFSPDLWRKFIKPRWAELYKMVKKIKPDIKIWYHSDGNISEIIPELIEIGVDILNPVQPECMDIYEIKKKYGDRLVLEGTIGTQSTMPFGTPEDVRRAVKDRKEKLGYDGALIISPTHILEPEVPIDNILAFCDECRK